MTYETYRYVFLGGAIAAGVLLAVSILLFFVLRIPKVISDLTGRTARKAIENIRMQNEQTGDKSYQSSAVNLERGKLTDKISKSGQIIPRDATPFGTGVITEKISTQKLSEEEPAGETTLLNSNETTLLSTDETSLLQPEFGETTLLQPDGVSAVNDTYSGAFKIEYEITFIHTTEMIG